VSLDEPRQIVDHRSYVLYRHGCSAKQNIIELPVQRNKAFKTQFLTMSSKAGKDIKLSFFIVAPGFGFSARERPGEAK
jgi:hypothetical protein